MAYTSAVHPDPETHALLRTASRVQVHEAVRGYELAQDGCLPISMFARYFELMRWELGRRSQLPADIMPQRWSAGRPGAHKKRI